MSPATGDDEGGGGVLGNLPRSRPGHRSDKRGGPDTVSAPAGRGGEAAADQRPSGGDDRPRPAARPVSPAPGAGSEGGGALDGAARAAGRAARLGMGVAGGVLRRLPRP